jgi:hypothetical protein
MATFFGQTVDVYEDMEDGSLDTVTETDTGSYLTLGNTAQHVGGSASMSVAANGGTAAYLGHDPSVDNWSVGFWVRTQDYTSTWEYGPDLQAGFGAPTLSRIITIREYMGDVHNLIVRWGGTDAYNDTLEVSDATWYWVTMQYNRDATSYVRIYSVAHALLGDYSQDLGDIVDAAAYFRIGVVEGTNAYTVYYDDLVMDWTSNTFPLLAWSVGGGTVVPQIMYHRRQQQ